MQGKMEKVAQSEMAQGRVNKQVKMDEQGKAAKVAKPAHKKMHKGGRNLMILGVVSVAIAMVTTGISLVIYHKSGDIYLDRSRPGFLPDEEEAEEEAEQQEEEYDFSKSGELSPAILEEYLEKLQVEVQAIDAYDKPFDSGVLSDERLGITPVEVDGSANVEMTP